MKLVIWLSLFAVFLALIEWRLMSILGIILNFLLTKPGPLTFLVIPIGVVQK